LPPCGPVEGVEWHADTLWLSFHLRAFPGLSNSPRSFG